MCCRHLVRENGCDGRGPGFRHGCVAAPGFQHTHRPHRHHTHHTHRPLNLVRHHESCWDHCQRRSGPCNWCGTRGWCCRHNEYSGGCDGNGPAFRHGCIVGPPDRAAGYFHQHTPHRHHTPPPTDASVNIVNNEAHCWDQPGCRSGVCGFCGAHAKCCRHNDAQSTSVGCTRGCGLRHCCIANAGSVHRHSPHRHHGHQPHRHNPHRHHGHNPHRHNPHRHNPHRHNPHRHHRHNPRLSNANANCWSRCHHRSGPCSWCGADGYCCRQNERGGGCIGSGGGFYHACIANPHVGWSG